ncbi:MAG: ImmA/IrrE family metallo-endopeptidase [Reyranella sp.]|nr:MAG: ImmA/IrrE family metallo-endopeptidase [Reyranella sp.]
MKAGTQRARETARSIIEEYGVKALPVPVERIIKWKGIVLQYAPLEDDLSGMAYIKDGVGIIGVNALHHPNRQRFTAAHELCHHLLHAKDIQKAVHVDKGFRMLLRDEVASQGIDRLEIEANAFASELLMPHKFFEGALDPAGLDLEDDAGIEALTKKFRVSAAAMRFRLASRF